MANPYALSDALEEQYELDDGFESFSRKNTPKLSKRRERHIARMVTARATEEDFKVEGITRGQIYAFFQRRSAKLMSAQNALQRPHDAARHPDIHKRVSSSMAIILAGLESPVCRFAIRHEDGEAMLKALDGFNPNSSKEQQLVLNLDEALAERERPVSYVVPLPERRNGYAELQDDVWRHRSQQLGLRARRHKL